MSQGSRDRAPPSAVFFIILRFMYHRGAFIEDINKKYLLCEKEDNGIEHVINNCKKLKKERNELIT